MTLISAAGLADALSRESGRPVLLDVRWSLAEPDGRDAYLAGHLPAAVYVSLEDELSSHGAPSEGRHPLPSRLSLEAAARRWGLNDGDAVVVYDAATSLAAARAWWLLRHAGVDVRILDGGLAAWAAAGGALEAGDVEVLPGAVTLDWGRMPVIDIDATAAFPERGVLLDARAGERFRGEVEPIDPQAGHIPGAVNVPMADYVNGDGSFLPTAEIAERYAAVGIDGSLPVASYCGSGVTAAHQVAALETIGITAALYPGSWSQWSNTPGREVATGEA
ncbi:sulfurtransferase [Demequina sp. NBRC 110051]|uniref:sulfurtransferase n=1 Tax=Demequina sp. NBRC 110051 TaxID=1570340 RepID=UPI000A062623|nr:sulfurtransferase [Demequina sp. NBRC 110051]